jgi:hypothetical protein
MFSTVIAGLWAVVIVMVADSGITAGITFFAGIGFQLKQVDGRWIEFIHPEQQNHHFRSIHVLTIEPLLLKYINICYANNNKRKKLGVLERRKRR